MSTDSVMDDYAERIAAVRHAYEQLLTTKLENAPGLVHALGQTIKSAERLLDDYYYDRRAETVHRFALALEIEVQGFDPDTDSIDEITISSIQGTDKPAIEDGNAAWCHIGAGNWGADGQVKRFEVHSVEAIFGKDREDD